MTSGFEQTWVPRLGTDGALALRGYRQWMYCLVPLAVAGAIIGGPMLGEHKPLGYALVLVAAVSYVLIVWRQVVLARELSVVFGARVRFYEVFALQPSGFDAWAKRRGLRPPVR
jgi:nicotinamide riboside transporter PnuC